MKASANNSLHTNRLYQTLRYLDSAEHKRLHKFLLSPYFNQSKLLVNLHQALLPWLEKDAERFDREAVWNYLYGKEKTYEDVLFRKLCSDLISLVKLFITHESLDESGITLLAKIAERRIEPLYSVSKEVESRIPENSFISNEYLKRFFYEQNLFIIKKYDEKIKDVALNVEEMSKNLDIFYLVEKLKIFKLAYAQGKLMKYEYQLSLIDEIEHMASAFIAKGVGEVALYYYAFAITIRDKQDDYYNFKSYLEKYLDLLPKDEAIDLFDAAMNYCTGKINQGQNQFMQEYFSMMEKAISKGLFIVNNEIKIWRFNNFVVTGLLAGKIDWTEDFINNYKDFLPETNRENTYTFNLARVYRYQKKYSEVIRLLQGVEYEDTAYNRISKAMLLISYYELDERAVLSNFLNTFQIFLTRQKKVPKARQIGYLNLIKYTRRLLRIRTDDKAAIEKLRTELDQNRARTVNYEWLMEKVNEKG